VLILLGIVLLLLLPSPWSWFGFAVCVILGVGELFLWNRKVRGQPIRGGSETLVGELGVAVTPCRPLGQVRVRGSIWAARSDTGVDEGQAVRVVDRKELTLIVEPSAEPAPV
jgi:membrane protein implicated in regulation of membrane protease activity